MIKKLLIATKKWGFVEKKVSVPIIYYISELNDYQFAVAEYMAGITLRALLLGEAPYKLSEIMEEVGAVLSKIALFKFKEAGFFDKDLNIISGSGSKNQIIVYVRGCLKNEIVKKALGVANSNNKPLL